MIREYTVNLPSLFLSKGIYWKVIAISQKKREKDEKERENKERKRDFIKDFEPNVNQKMKIKKMKNYKEKNIVMKRKRQIRLAIKYQKMKEKERTQQRKGELFLIQQMTENSRNEKNLESPEAVILVINIASKK